jgi:hypothetical protein
MSQTVGNFYHVPTFCDDESARHSQFKVDSSFGWHDLAITGDGDTDFRQQIAGHLETGNDSVSDPALGSSPERRFSGERGRRVIVRSPALPIL